MLPLMFVPGLLCDAALWTQPRRELGGARQVLVADHMTGASIHRMASMLLSAAPPRFALAGMSMGGYVALEVARLAPERVDRLALLDTNAHADSPESSAGRQKQVDEVAAGRFEAVVEELLVRLVHPDHLARPEVTGTFRAMAARSGPAVFARQQQAIMTRQDQTALLPQLAMPALVLCGAEDQLTPPDKHRDMAARIPGARLVIVPHCGHLAPLEQPGAVTDALRTWLES